MYCFQWGESPTQTRLMFNISVASSQWGYTWEFGGLSLWRVRFGYNAVETSLQSGHFPLENWSLAWRAVVIVGGWPHHLVSCSWLCSVCSYAWGWATQANWTLFSSCLGKKYCYEGYSKQQLTAISSCYSCRTTACCYSLFLDPKPKSY